MPFHSINVTIEPRSFFPWQSQKIQVEGKDMFFVERSYRLLSGKTYVKEYSTVKKVISIYQPRLQSTRFLLDISDKQYHIRRISYWQWECRCGNEYIMLNRLGGLKCILTHNGRQLAIMSLGSQLPFVADPNTYLRVNGEDKLHLAIATALIVKSISIHFNPMLLDNSQLRPIQSVELA
ncbi:MAG: hypothetical protein ACLFUB_09760 [Cyclobacteriaceae bacterium]